MGIERVQVVRVGVWQKQEVVVEVQYYASGRVRVHFLMQAFEENASFYQVLKRKERRGSVSVLDLVYVLGMVLSELVEGSED